MTSIRTILSNHSPIIARESRPGYALIEQNDLSELHLIAGRHIDFSLAGRTSEGLPLVEVRQEDLKKLAQDAHDQLHAPSEEAKRLLDAITDHDIDQFVNSSEDEDGDEEDGVEEQLRNIAMHYATQVTVASIQAAHGLDGASFSVVKEAEGILKFLKGE